MRETRKSNAYRNAQFFECYCRGKVIDIGCGDDPVTAMAEGFERQDGDANEILQYRTAQSYDCVYSSHCLEHMRDPRTALAQWWQLLRPGGYLVLVVPHEDLYEQGYWPSVFNQDHKATFRLGGTASWSPKSIDLTDLVSSLAGSEIVSAEVQDSGYDHRLRGCGRPHPRHLRKLARWLFRKKSKLPALARPADACVRLLTRLGCPIDQTETDALAQIQIVARKQS